MKVHQFCKVCGTPESKFNELRPYWSTGGMSHKKCPICNTKQQGQMISFTQAQLTFLQGKVGIDLTKIEKKSPTKNTKC